MNLELSEEHSAVRRLARDFVEREVAPHATAWDRAEEVDRGIVKKLGELGFLGLTIDERYGGCGGDHLAYCLVTEELGRGDGTLGPLDLLIQQPVQLGPVHVHRLARTAGPKHRRRDRQDNLVRRTSSACLARSAAS